jgi:hypothetical protein
MNPRPIGIEETVRMIRRLGHKVEVPDMTSGYCSLKCEDGCDISVHRLEVMEPELYEVYINSVWAADWDEEWQTRRSYYGMAWCPRLRMLL